MLVFSPSIHEAISHMRFVTTVRILDDRPPPGMHRPSCMPAPEWRHIRADVYPADGCTGMLNHNMTINRDNVHLLHPYFNCDPDPTELLARNRLSNADASRHWVHGESVDGYAHPPPKSGTKKRKRATVFNDGCELKTVHEIRRATLQLPSRLRTRAPKNAYDAEPAFCAMYAPEAWYCRDPRLMAREPEGIEREVPGFVFATPAVSLNDIDKYAGSVDEDVMDSLVCALDRLSLDDYVPPVIDEAQAFLEDVFSTMIQLGDNNHASEPMSDAADEPIFTCLDEPDDVPFYEPVIDEAQAFLEDVFSKMLQLGDTDHAREPMSGAAAEPIFICLDEPNDVPFYEPTVFNSADEPHGMDAMPTVIIEISDDESNDGDDGDETQADDRNGGDDSGCGDEDDSGEDEDDLDGANYYANLLASPTPLSRDPSASILASLIHWGIGDDG